MPPETYVGTSAVVAGKILAGGPNICPETASLEEARKHARLHGAVDGSGAVVLRKGSKGFLVVESVAIAGATPRERLGFSETAGLADILTSILDAAHRNIKKAIDVGAGNDSAHIPSLREIRDAYSGKLHTKNYSGEHYTKNRKPRSKKKDPVDSNKELDDAHEKVQQGLKKIGRHVHKQIGPGGVKRKKPLGKKPLGKKPKVRKGVVKAPKKVLKKANAPARTQPFGPNNPNPHGPKTAGKDITVRGKINGKASRAVVRKGTDYQLVHTPLGTILKRQGGRGAFIVAPSDVGKL